ncbi:hypothetical protein [Botrimarina hoheduenensis]|uniref:DUF2092 domain-containing protein n=1 Tax=Botrimarina hoheduenensis TaxID=2528000 RepID=A0A5C5VTA9_9BACT|nr:hypothetical protein [Botrimarina hoheduenensis]TWT41550.1 hypothetical protein Pla111_29270 [Botrimarina hoheduenensis]
MGNRLRDRATGFLWRALLLVAVGGGAFIGLQAIDNALMPLDRSPRTAFSPDEAPVVPGAPPLATPAANDTRGNRYIAQAQLRLAQIESLSASVSYEGISAQRITNLTGRYLQRGAGTNLHFSLLLRGKLADEPARLLRVSDSRFLWNDLIWDAVDRDGQPDPADRQISRIDLRRIGRDGGEHPGNTEGDPADSALEDRFGGLPTLLAKLARDHDFAAPRMLQLGGDRVLALIGERRTPVTPVIWPDTSPTDAHHVLVALEERSLTPRLIEFRGFEDPLSLSGTPLETRLQPSRQPLLRMRCADVQTGLAIPDSAFAYERPKDVPWRDETQRELQAIHSAARLTPSGAQR